MSDPDLNTPLAPAAFHILMALAGGALHGYAIMQAVRDQSDGRVPLRTGALYWHLTRLIAAGLVAESAPPRSVQDSRRGTHYRVTPHGRAILEREIRHLESVLTTHRRLRTTSRKASS